MTRHSLPNQYDSIFGKKDITHTSTRLTAQKMSVTSMLAEATSLERLHKHTYPHTVSTQTHTQNRAFAVLFGQALNHINSV